MIILLLILLIIPTGVMADVAFDASDTPGSTNSGTAVTTTHTNGCTANCLIIACHMTYNQASTGATYNGVAMTAIDNQTASDGARRLTMYYLLGPAFGSNTLQGTTATATTSMITGKTFSGVNQNTPLGTQAKGNGGAFGTSLSATVTGTATGMDTDCLITDQTASLHSANGGQSNTAISSASNTAFLMSSTKPGSGSDTLGWSWTTGAFRSIIVVPLIAAPNGRFRGAMLMP